MRYHLPRTFTKAAFLAGSLALLLGLLIVPLSATNARADGDVGTSAVTLQLYGPDSITATGNYTYHAYFGAPYPSFYWYSRTCSTATLSSCTVTWTRVLQGISTSGSNSYYTQRLTWDCSGNGTRSFQVKVEASGFGQPTQTAYKVTRLCGAIP